MTDSFTRIPARQEHLAYMDIKAVLKDQSGKIDKLLEAVHAGRLENEKRFGTIEGRLTGIEAKVETKATKTDVAAIETKLATLEGKVNTVDGRVGLLPTTTAMIATTMSAVGLSLAGAAGLAFTLFKIFKP